MFNMYSILTFLKHKTSIYPHIIFTAFLLLVFHFTICARLQTTICRKRRIREHERKDHARSGGEQDAKVETGVHRNLRPYGISQSTWAAGNRNETWLSLYFRASRQSWLFGSIL